LEPIKKKISSREAKNELWRRGCLVFKCHEVQKEMYELFYKSEPHTVHVWLLARQSGKSVLLAILALEAALRAPNSVVKLLTDTKVHLESIFEKIFQELLADCPEDIKPEYMKAKFIYQFPNGSQIQLAGSDSGHYERLRGSKAVLVLIDEAGFCTNLEDIVKSVLIPTTTHTKGKIILASTPPEDEEHEFIKFIEEAENVKTLIKKTIDDNPLLTEEEKKDIEKKMGGRHSERFRREYLVEIVKNSSTSVIPEFNEDLVKDIVKDWPRPPFFDGYVAMDLGFKDLTAVLFGYYDFRADKIIIEDEIIYDFKKKDASLPKFIAELLKKEEDLWLNPLTQEIKKPYLRVSDIDYIVMQEISRASHNQLNFLATKKDDLQAAINNLRVLLANHKIIINPRCETLIKHLKNVKWKSAKNKDVFGRSPDSGHYDAAHAAIYLARNIIFSKNPYPAHYGMGLQPGNFHVHNPIGFNNPNNTQVNILQKIFNNRNKNG
jgi:hypothetical protein